MYDVNKIRIKIKKKKKVKTAAKKRTLQFTQHKELNKRVKNINPNYKLSISMSGNIFFKSIA